MNRPCLDCGTPTPNTRCPPCQRAHQRRRPTRTARGYGPNWQRIRSQILANQPTCAICRTAPATTVDHITPKNRGGTDHPTNLQPACHPCNSGKRDR